MTTITPSASRGFTFAVGLALLLLSAACSPPAADTAEQSTLAETSPVPEAAPDTPPGLIHTVFFWLRDDLTEEERAAFVEGNRSMSVIPSVRKLYFGPPAATEARDVVDNTYDYALILHFDDVAGQNAYQVHPLHKQMVELHSEKFARVVVYDSQVMN